jgi:hypothetical protein
LNPCEFHGISRIKHPNKGRRFGDETGLVVAYDQVIEEINAKEWYWNSASPTALGACHPERRRILCLNI